MKLQGYYFKTLIQLRKRRPVAGQYHITMKITVNDDIAEIQTGVKMTENEFKDYRLGNFESNDMSMKAAIFQNLESRAVFEFSRLVNEGAHVSAALIRDVLQGKRKGYSLLELAAEYVQVKADSDLRERSIKGLKTHLKHLDEFLSWSGNRGLLISKVDVHFAEKFVYYLRHEKNHKYGHVRAITALVKSTLRYAYTLGYTKEDPLRYWVSPKFQHNPIEFLTESEVIDLQRIRLEGSEEISKDLFLFQIFTGLGYSDMQDFQRSWIRKNKFGEDWIIYERAKIKNSRASLPLLEEAREVLKKYDYKLPEQTNQVMNRNLKIIAEKMNLSVQKLTTHVGRKTFGMICLNRGVSLEVVSKCMGHASTEMTRKHYAFILDDTISREMSVMKKQTGTGAGYMQVV